MTDATELDTAVIRETWLRQCGPCDAGLPMACVCSDADPRPVIERLLAALDEARQERDAWRSAATAYRRTSGYARARALRAALATPTTPEETQP